MLRAIPLLLRAALRILAGAGALLLLVSFIPVLEWWTNALSGPWGEGGGGTLIVLGSDTNRDIIGEHSYWRAVYAVWAWRGGGFQQVLISGPQTMRDFLVANGVPADRIRVESRSNSTRENALFTASMLSGDSGRKTLLTSDYHIFRAVRAFRKIGVDVVPNPVPDAGKRIYHRRLRWAVFVDLVEETTKIVYYRARGWI